MKKRVLRLYTAGAYRRNQQDLDRRSQAGWQLEKTGWLRDTFTQGKNPHRHLLDYCPGILGDQELARRKRLFLEAGWELVDTTPSSWRVFRRMELTALPEEAYDSPCPYLPEEERWLTQIGWLRLLLVPVVAAGAVLAVIAVVRGKGMALPAVVFLLLVLALVLRIQSLQQRLRP